MIYVDNVMIIINFPYRIACLGIKDGEVFLCLIFIIFMDTLHAGRNNNNSIKSRTSLKHPFFENSNQSMYIISI